MWVIISVIRFQCPLYTTERLKDWRDVDNPAEISVQHSPLQGSSADLNITNLININWEPAQGQQNKSDPLF